LLAADDPRVAGHVHDGARADGHAGKIDLIDHVSGQLQNQNLGDKAVTKRTVFDTITVSEAIPEYTEDGSITKYLLDLRGLRADLTFQEDSDPSSAASAITENKIIRQKDQTWNGSSLEAIEDVWSSAEGFDFVFGSSSLEDLDLGGDGDSRFFFDKSNSAFRAGTVDHTQWDEANRGIASVALGADTEASGDYSVISGGKENLVEAALSAVVSGTKNTIKSGAETSVVLGGKSNTIEAGEASMVCGASNLIEASEEAADSPDSSSVIGFRGHSHMWGQNTQASGAYNPENPVLSDFPLNSSSAGLWTLFTKDVGSAQVFSATMFGHFNYSRANIATSSVPYPTTTVAYLDGAEDTASPKRAFFPRANCSYSIRIEATISYTYWDQNTLNVSEHNSTAFLMNGGVVCKNDGSFDYKMTSLLETFDSGALIPLAMGTSGSRVTSPAAPVGGGASDFEVFFCHDETAPTDAGTGIAKGSSLKFVMLNQSDQVGSNLLVGESVAVKLTVVENMLNVFREPTV